MFHSLVELSYVTLVSMVTHLHLISRIKARVPPVEEILFRFAEKKLHDLSCPTVKAFFYFCNINNEDGGVGSVTKVFDLSFDVLLFVHADLS